ncbi:hypothetical protein [uncultured Methanobacterium sp.]|uniref:hypothetical protein n=1 Tax=uncultured Methanobacterium sp. TaxID=176306 RepID=UPI002AA94041|nr:hypothetical protein [uncultured Methanobacterium sp.]
MRMKDVRQYAGRFTGKMVKPLDKEDVSEFQKGDKVVVFHLKDYLKFLDALDTVMHGTEEERDEIVHRLGIN